jgi:CMP-N-acetylneuraminic acid synthetase
MKIAAVLTARGGSSLKLKCLREVAGKPLLAWPLAAANGVHGITWRYASTDSVDIMNAAEELGYKPIRRPDIISGPTARHIDAVNHAILYLAERGMRPDVVVWLMGNSVCTTTWMIEDCLEMLNDHPEANSEIPVVQDNDHHPWRAKTLNRKGYLHSYVDFTGLDVSTNRQDLSPCYWIAQNFWVTRLPMDAEHGEAPWTFLGPNVLPYIIPYPCPDVHTEMDLLLSEQWVKEHYGCRPVISI